MFTTVRSGRESREAEEETATTNNGSTPNEDPSPSARIVAFMLQSVSKDVGYSGILFCNSRPLTPGHLTLVHLTPGRLTSGL